MWNKWLRVLAAFVCAVMIVQLPASVSAAGTGKRYVEEVIVSYGEGDGAADSAKNWLIANGYQVLDADLNSGAESGAILGSPRPARAVYLGYKTTTDISKAITSLKVMNMTGNYSFDEYQKVLDETKAERAEFMQDFAVTLEEWRTNYRAGKAKAVQAFKLLNLMYDDDKANTALGTLLLQPTAEEMGEAYDALSDEEKLKHADMTTILMQGNTEMVIYLEQILAMGADTSADTWLDRMQEIGTYNDMLDLMEKEAEENGEAFIPTDAQKELATSYDAVAGTLALKMGDLRDMICEYEKSGTSLEDDEQKVDKFLDSNLESGISLAWVNAASLTEIIKEIEYPSDTDDDRTLYNFVMQDFDADSLESRKELYPMAASLSEGQAAAVEFMSIANLLTNGITTNKDIKNGEAETDELLSPFGHISVYCGVDRSVFDSSSTALTDAARKLQVSGNRSYVDEFFGVDWSTTTYIAAGIFVTGLAATAGCGIAATVMHVKTAPKKAYDGLVQKIIDTWKAKGYDDLGHATASMRADALIIRAGNETKAAKYMKGYEAAKNYKVWMDDTKKLANAFTVASCVLVVVTIAAGVWAVISGTEDLKKYYNREYDLYPIPDHMVDQITDANGTKSFVMYDAVQCNRTAEQLTLNREILKDNADLNGDLGKEWLALYSTTDVKAGKPITVSDISGFKVVTGGITEEGMIPLTLFGRENPVNLCNTDWVWNDIHNGLSLYYTVDNTAYAASIFDKADPVFIAGGAAILAGVIAFPVGLLAGKKKTRKKQSET